MCRVRSRGRSRLVAFGMRVIRRITGLRRKRSWAPLLSLRVGGKIKTIPCEVITWISTSSLPTVSVVRLGENSGRNLNH